MKKFHLLFSMSFISSMVVFADSVQAGQVHGTCCGGGTTDIKDEITKKVSESKEIAGQLKSGKTSLHISNAHKTSAVSGGMLSEGTLMTEEEKNKSFLIVDDIGPNITNLKTMLEVVGYKHVAGETDPKNVVSNIEAQLAQNKPYFAVILDYEMPGMNGDEVLLKIREHKDPRISQLLVIAHSSEKKFNDELMREIQVKVANDNPIEIPGVEPEVKKYRGADFGVIKDGGSWMPIRKFVKDHPLNGYPWHNGVIAE